MWCIHLATCVATDDGMDMSAYHMICLNLAYQGIWPDSAPCRCMGSAVAFYRYTVDADWDITNCCLLAALMWISGIRLPSLCRLRSCFTLKGILLVSYRVNEAIESFFHGWFQQDRCKFAYLVLFSIKVEVLKESIECTVSHVAVDSTFYPDKGAVNIGFQNSLRTF